MAQSFKEKAHLNTDPEKYESNYDKIFRKDKKKSRSFDKPIDKDTEINILKHKLALANNLIDEILEGNYDLDEYLDTLKITETRKDTQP